MRALADLAASRPKRVLALAALFFILAGALGGSVAQRLYPYGADDKTTESVQARDRLERATGLHPGIGIVALVRTPDGVRSAAAHAKVRQVARELRSDRAVGRVVTFYDSRDRAMVARDGRATYITAQFRPISDKQLEGAAKRLQRRLRGEPGVKLGGFGVAFVQVNKTVEADLKRAELLAFPLLFGLSLLFFRSLVAALLPPLVGGLAIVATFLALRVASELGEISVFALNLTTGLGLGLAIDYSLFIVSRYREELARVGPGREALRRTLATAGRTVLFSSLTVASALASLLVFPQRFLYSMAVGGAVVALIACAVALVVLPAVLSVLGTRVNALAPARLQRAAERDARPAASGTWYRLSRFVMRRPGRIAVLSAATLIAFGLPFMGIRFTSVDASVLPRNASARQVDDALKAGFPPYRTSPIYLAVKPPAGSAAATQRRLHSLSRRIGELPGIARVGSPQVLGNHLALIQAFSRHGALTDASQRLVRRIRDLPTRQDVLVGGETAQFIDTKASLRRHLPIAFAIIVVSTFVILFLMTGSVVLPVKALVMNVLTLSAAFGLLVLIFQDGRLEGLLGYTSQGALEVTMPVLLFAVVFGLSTDYGVFLLSRIKEARDGGASDGEAVAIGLERTGRIVTAAATLFCVAIGAFATSRIIFIKENGVGTALAVLIDASLVRALLVPSLMELLGALNWWAPRPLRRLHARVGLAEGAVPPAA
jgi:RND superfamily putative drug exporter